MSTLRYRYRKQRERCIIIQSTLNKEIQHKFTVSDDSTRVVLETDNADETDYINASFINVSTQSFTLRDMTTRNVKWRYQNQLIVSKCVISSIVGSSHHFVSAIAPRSSRSIIRITSWFSFSLHCGYHRLIHL